MAYQPLGQFGESLHSPDTLDFRNVRGGVITSKELIIAGGTQGVIRSQNFDSSANTGWRILGDGSAVFNDVTVRGDVSAGSITSGTLSTGEIIIGDTGTNHIILHSEGGDTNIASDDFVSGSTGWKIYANGSAEFSNVTVRGVVESSIFRTASSGARLEIDGQSGDEFIGIYGSDGSAVGFVGYSPTGYGADTMVLSTETNTDNIELNADGGINLIAGGSAGDGVWIRSDAAGGVPGEILIIANSGGGTKYFTFQDTPKLIGHSQASAGDLHIYESADDWFFLNKQQDNGIVIYDGSGGVELWYNGSSAFQLTDPDGVQVDKGNLVMAEDGSEIQWSGTTGPVGLRFLGEGRLYYRSNPNTLTFEDSGGTEIFGFDQDNGHGWMESPQTTTNSGLASWRHDNFAASGSAVYDFLPLVSSRRFKKHISKPGNDFLASVVDQVDISRWKERREVHKDINRHDTSHRSKPWIYGIMAEEAAEVPYLEDLVGKTDDGEPLHFDPVNAMAMPMLAALKDARARITELEKQVAALTK